MDLEAIVDFLAYGLTGWNWIEIVVFTLVVTHITIAGVTIYLHRCQAHRAVELHPIVSHFFRFWMWLTTGMVTAEWASIHRKHHAKCETPLDPHSPQVEGLSTVMWQGADLYRLEAKNKETLERYSHGCPDDWIERNLYTKHSAMGVALMMVINVLLMGAAGVAVWAVQMMWIPFFAAGIINGVGHFWGYRNFKSPDASTNILPWGILIGGEELHNNHHSYATSPKLSAKWYEFDIGWAYIRTLQMLGLAKPRALPPAVQVIPAKVEIDAATIQAANNSLGSRRPSPKTSMPRPAKCATHSRPSGPSAASRLSRLWRRCLFGASRPRPVAARPWSSSPSAFAPCTCRRSLRKRPASLAIAQRTVSRA
ncbi:MAG: hypothetical protein RI968_1052 [Pseudomonadota bacterium]